ncbi:MAG: pyridoxamine 5-phosphate oxidase [Actinomycetota bacterium]|nr:pyridoxamine 5-phosphate oxidase [Actinomycetota bacterium]
MTDPRDMQAPTGFHTDVGLDRAQLNPDPFAQFTVWLADAEAAGVPLPNAMALATTGDDGQPRLRHVLLRGVDVGFVFNTHKDSRKGRQLAENPRAALSFVWKALDRQVSIVGSVEDVLDAESDRYFTQRPREAQIGAWASQQSEVISGRDVLEERVREFEERFAGSPVPRPPRWGGYRVIPKEFEFWQGRLHRLHDRFRYLRGDDIWTIERLAP